MVDELNWGLAAKQEIGQPIGTNLPKLLIMFRLIND